MEDIISRYDAPGRELVEKAARLSQRVLDGAVRSNGAPFFGHPAGVARIAAVEIGLPAGCVAAVFTHRGQDYECIMFNPVEYVRQTRQQQQNQARPTDSSDGGDEGTDNWDKLLAKLGSNIYWNENGVTKQLKILPPH